MVINFKIMDVTTGDRHFYSVAVNEILFDQPFVVAAIGILRKTKAQGDWIVEDGYINNKDDIVDMVNEVANGTVTLLYNDDNNELMTLEDIVNQATPDTIGEITVCGMRIIEI